MDLKPKGDIFQNGKGEGVGPLEDHSHFFTELNQIGPRGINILFPDEDLSFDANAFNQVIHPVQTAQQGGFTAPRGADQGGNGLFLKKGRYAFQGME